MEAVGLKPTNPRPHQLYRREVDNYLGKHSFDCDRIREELLEVFREASRELTRRVIGEWIEANRVAMGLTQKDVAEYVGVSAGAVTKWINGDSKISQDHHDTLICWFGANGIECLGADARERALSGYRKAVSYMRRVITAEQCPPPSREEILCLFLVYSEPNWGNLRKARACDCRFVPLARSIFSRANSSYGASTSQPGSCRIQVDSGHVCLGTTDRPEFEDVRRINAMIRRWGTAWLICIACIPEAGAI